MTLQPTLSERMLAGLVEFFTDRLYELLDEGKLEAHSQLGKRKLCEKRIWGGEFFNSKVGYGPDTFCIAAYHEITHILSTKKGLDERIDSMLDRVEDTLQNITDKSEGISSTDRPIENLVDKWHTSWYDRSPEGIENLFKTLDPSFHNYQFRSTIFNNKSILDALVEEEAIHEMSETEEYWEQITDEAREIMLAKNEDYGEVWKDMLPTSLVDEILIKAKRSRNLMQKHSRGEEAKVSEGVLSELRDIINYCVFAHYAWTQVLAEEEDD